MAAFGFGVGDLIAACNAIYSFAVKYKNAPKEFDEIAEKAKSTAVVLSRIEVEAATAGNLVERAGPEASDQLAANLVSLKKDSDKLEELVRKYDKIHDEGPGRRALFAFKESGDLTDLRRRIGLHEQTLQLWYMTLVYGSLRRIEGGQEEILRGIDKINGLSDEKFRRMQQSVLNRDRRALAEELRKMGVGVGPGPPWARSHSRQRRHSRYHAPSRHDHNNFVAHDSDYDSSDDDDDGVDPTVLKAMSEYIVATPRQQRQMETELRSASVMAPHPIVSPVPPFYPDRYRSRSATRQSGSGTHEGLYRTKSTGHERSRPTPDLNTIFGLEAQPSRSSNSQQRPSSHRPGDGLLRVPGESFRPRRSSDTASIQHSDIVIQRTDRPARPTSYHGPEIRIEHLDSRGATRRAQDDEMRKLEAEKMKRMMELEARERQLKEEIERRKMEENRIRFEEERRKRRFEEQEARRRLEEEKIQFEKARKRQEEETIRKLEVYTDERERRERSSQRLHPLDQSSRDRSTQSFDRRRSLSRRRDEDDDDRDRGRR